MPVGSIYQLDAVHYWRSAAAAAVASLILAQSPALAQSLPERLPPSPSVAPAAYLEFEQIPEGNRPTVRQVSQQVEPAPSRGRGPTPAEAPAPSGAPAPAVVPAPTGPLPPDAARPPEPETVAPRGPIGEVAPDPRDGFVLSEAEWIALRFNPVMRQQLAQWGSAQGRAVQAGLLPNPVIGNNPNPIQLSGSTSLYAVGVQQEVVVMHKKRLDRAAVEQEVRQAEWSYLRARYDVLYDVRSQFYVTLIAQARVHRLAQIAEITQRSTDISRQLEQAGEGSRLDVLQLRIEHQRAHAAVQNAEQVLFGQRKILAARMGIPVEQLPPVIGDFAVALPNYEESQALRYVMSSHAQAQIAAIDIRRNQILLDRARVEPIPNPTAQVGYQASPTEPQNQPFIALFAEIPLFDRNQGNIRSQQNEVAAASARMNVTQNTLASQLAASLSQYRAASLVVERYEREILPAAREAQEAIQRGYTQGEFDLLRVLQSQRTYFDAELGYLDAQEQRWTSAAAVSSLLQEEKFP